MKKTIIMTALATVLLVCSCQQEHEEVYSCNKQLNKWAHQNLKSIRSMDREAWLQLDEDYKRPAFVALTPEQKLLFWQDKLKEVMTTLEWSEAEMEHLMKLYRYLEEHPDLYTPESLNDSVQNDAFARFAYQWRNDAMIDLNWSEELIYGILFTGNHLLDKEGNFQVMVKKRVMTNRESASDRDCNCNKERDRACKDTDCNGTASGCGELLRFSCNGEKV